MYVSMYVHMYACMHGYVAEMIYIGNRGSVQQNNIKQDLGGVPFTTDT